MMAESLLDAITGGLLGVAAGDALGATVELMTPEEIEEKYEVIDTDHDGESFFVRRIHFPGADDDRQIKKLIDAIGKNAGRRGARAPSMPPPRFRYAGLDHPGIPLAMTNRLLPPARLMASDIVGTCDTPPIARRKRR